MGLAWFKTRRERKAFEAADMACVYVAGLMKGRSSLRLGWCKDPNERIVQLRIEEDEPELEILDLVWFADMRLAMRALNRIKALLAKFIRPGDWLAVPLHTARSALRASPRAINIPAIEHAEMLNRIRKGLEAADRRALSGF